MKKENKIENSLIVPKKENIFTRFVKWASNLFGKREQIIENKMESVQEITIPKSVKVPEKIEVVEKLDENSIEYLYKLSDDELDKLDKMYDQQMEETKDEILKLENILQKYKCTIRKLQGQIENNNET